MKFFCIGDRDTVTGFRFAGVDGTVVESPAEARKALAACLARADIAVIIIPDPMAAELHKEINDVRFNRPRPAIVEIPGPEGRTPGRPTMIDLIREAIGVRV